MVGNHLAGTGHVGTVDGSAKHYQGRIPDQSPVAAASIYSTSRTMVAAASEVMSA